ncbi:MAG: SagB/ThcOx family dehydrogenase [Pseudomonadota bacterium]
MIETSAQYHQKTSYDRFSMSGHTLDWENQPRVFKEYPGMETIPLPEDVPPPDLKLSSLLQGKRGETRERRFNLEDLSLILHLTHTLTARARVQGGDFYYRSAASTGALYPTEIYVAAEGLDGLGDGLYHFAIHRHGLCRLREGTVSGRTPEISETAGSEVTRLTLFFTAIFFRSAWKYRERAYRYHLLDTGHVIENLVLALRALRLPCRLSYDFDDRLTNDFLGLDDSREVSLAVAHIAGRMEMPGEDGLPVKRLPDEILEASRVSDREVPYPVIGEIHRAGIPGASSPDERIERVPALGITPATGAGLERPTEGPEKMN